MMRKRNVISLLLTFCLCFSMISPVSATDINEVSDNLYIFSKQCAEEYINFAQETVGYMLWDHSVENPYLGTPFTFSNEDSDIYYFPICEINRCEPFKYRNSNQYIVIGFIPD